MAGSDPFLPPIVARAAGHGDRTAIIDRGQRYTYADLDRSSAHVASRLIATQGSHGILNETRVAFLVAPSFNHVALQWGIWRAGGIAVPLPISHSPAELEFLIRDADAAIVVADEAGAEVVADIAGGTGARFLRVKDVAAGSPTAPAAPAAPGQRAMILYTSGTTNRPKGVVTTHDNITAQIESLVTAWEWTSGDRTLLVLPLHHVHGIVNVVSCALWSGATLEIHSRFDAHATWTRLASGDLTVFTAVPTIYHRLIAAWDAAPADVRNAWSERARNLRLMMSGSAALPRGVLDRWRELTGHVLLERYGMTEVGMALANPLHGERRPGFVGTPLPGVTARIVDGELQLKGAGVFTEYWRNPERTREAFMDGWFRTGDIAVIEDGSYRLLGRSSVDIIKSGGDKISALEIEETLRDHPAIAECAVVGIDDPEWGQRVCCAVELRPGHALELSDLRDWARRRLAGSKLPKEVICVAQLPRNAMGKVVKPEVTTFFAPPAPPSRQDP